MEELIARLARSCAHGVRQMELVNELLVQPAQITKFHVPGQWGPPVNQYGGAHLGGSSFVNLKKRLVANGFFFDYNHDRTQIRMRFSK